MPRLTDKSQIEIDAKRLERRRRATVRSREDGDRHDYFRNVAEARYVLRKIFRIIEEQAKFCGIDSMARQALIQIYGSPNAALRVKEVAARLDITPAFASSLVKTLLAKRYVQRKRCDEDHRAAWIEVTDVGKKILHEIDERVQVHVDYFNHQLRQDQREAALAILMFYVGVSLMDR